MRLSDKQLTAIKETFAQVFKQGRVYLFGSRTDEMQRGGDIDLYIDSNVKENLSSKRVEFLVKLKRIIGEQKIDIVFRKDDSREIEREAIKNGILINEI
jgi:predicted nucleotidyltransferase